MNIDKAIVPAEWSADSWTSRHIQLGDGRSISCGYRFLVKTDTRLVQTPDSFDARSGSKGNSELSARFGEFAADVSYKADPTGRWIDESVILQLGTGGEVLRDIQIGLEIDSDSLNGFRATPIPLRVSMKGELQEVDIAAAADCARYAEGWIIENGTDGLLVMRVPSGDAHTCFVPLVIRTADSRRTVQIGSLGPDGEDHRERSCYLDTPWPSDRIAFPTTRFVFFKGGWRTGYEIFRRMAASCISRRPDPRRKPCPISYNTYHDFGPKYDRRKIVELMPVLADMGFGLIHLDPGWETVWGSNDWGEEHMGSVESLVEEARKYGLEVGCWTSVHCTDPDVHGDNYTRSQSGEKFYAEDFAIFNPEWNRLWGICPASGWQDDAVGKLSRLGRAGFRFLNSDFHDWPWGGDSCWYDKHRHRVPLTRAQWCEALNDMYIRLHRECPEMVIELHDHVESGEYRVPVWYLYDRPDSWDEKWAYEFMWKTFDDLMAHRLFSLYYIRLAEPIPLFLHMNASTDNEHAVAFWYVASCVNHIGVGAIVKSTDAQRAAYKKAFADYNARFEAFARGEFYGIDELIHVHVYPDRRRAVILVFNLDDSPAEREFALDPESWNMFEGEIRVSGASLAGRIARVNVPGRGVSLIDVEVK